jgi:hypothetical protein
MFRELLLEGGDTGFEFRCTVELREFAPHYGAVSEAREDR